MNQTIRKRALLLGTGLLIILLVSCIFIYLRYRDTSANYTACIYQQGILVEQINLSSVTEEYTLTFYAPDGGKNVVRISPDGIAITEADCPDLLCVHQGTIRNDLLPITCLPNRVVIRLTTEDGSIDAVSGR